MITYIQSKNISDYTILLDGLYSDFGSHLCHTILCWCGLMKSSKSFYQFWQVWIVKQDDKTIGICGLYSLDDKVDTLWLGWFGILPELRNQRLGENVINYLKDTSIEVGASKLMSYVDQDGKPLPFYQRNGFIVKCRVGEYVKEHNLDISEFEDENDYIIEYTL